jgi:hypothetical protein
VLDLSKLENNKMALAQHPVNLYNICQEVNTLLRPTIHQGVKLLVDVDSEQWMVGDQLRLRQLLVNLLSNAFKFTKKGVVHVRTSVRLCNGSENSGEKNCSEKNGSENNVSGIDTGRDGAGPQEEGQPLDVSYRVLDVSISDTGIGVSPETALTLFKKFESNAFAHKGSGVGLALSQHITVLMGGGEIKVDSPYRLTKHNLAGGMNADVIGDEAVDEGAMCSGTRLSFSVPFIACDPPVAGKESSSTSSGSTSSSGSSSSSSSSSGSTSTTSTTTTATTTTTTTTSGIRDPVAWNWGGSNSNSPRMSFLLVEDDAMNQMIMKAKLQQLWGGGKEFVRSDGEMVHCVVECTAVDTAERALELKAAGKERSDLLIQESAILS